MSPTLQLGVKQPGQMLAATSISGQAPSRLFHTSGLTFLVDTGAEVSVIPPTSTEHKHPHANLTLQSCEQPTHYRHSVPARCP